MNSIKYSSQIIAAEISAISRYYDNLVQWNPLSHDSGELFESVENTHKRVIESVDELLAYKANAKAKDKGGRQIASQIILLNGNLNHEPDIQSLLSRLKARLNRESRIVAVVYNPYFKWLYQLGNFIGLRKGGQPITFLTLADANNLAKLCGLKLVRVRHCVYVPFKLFGIGDVFNAYLPSIPVLRNLAFVLIMVFRPLIVEKQKPSLSIIVPAKNEKGNLEALFESIPHFDGADIEVILVEGNSSDGTAEEITRLVPIWQQKFPIISLQQTGKGKSDAVQLGFAKANNDLLVILDADLSTPAAYLERFYDAYCLGLADFINGNRLVYPTEKGSMPFINKLGNIFFARALSLVLGMTIGDSLCGSKMFSKYNYLRFCQWRKDFGELDPFGDFDLLFPAAVLSLGIIDVPIRYKERVYGRTNIQRFVHGGLLFCMLLAGVFKITLGRTGKNVNRV